MLSSRKFSCSCGVQDKLSSTNGSSDSAGRKNARKPDPFHGSQEWAESAGIGSVCSNYGLPHAALMEQELHLCTYQQQQQRTFWDYALFDDVRFDTQSPPLEASLEEIAKLGKIRDGMQGSACRKEMEYLSSSELLKHHGRGLSPLKTESAMEPSNDTPGRKMAGQELSTEQIIGIAGARFIQTSSLTIDIGSMLKDGLNLSLSGLSTEEAKNVELAELLLASAEKIGNQQYKQARLLLRQCDYYISNTGNPVQLVAYYICEALQERMRINMKTGGVTTNRSPSLGLFDDAMMIPSPAFRACQELLPFPHVTQGTGIQTILDNVAKAKKIHVIELVIRNEAKWMVLMQALASRCECPLELLRITAIGTHSMELIEETGKRLASFARTLNLHFSFKVVTVSDFLELKEHLLEVDVEETVAVYSEFLGASLIGLPNRIDSIMRVIRSIKPHIMVFAEVEANQNSPIFVYRFIESLFFSSALFDCYEACMERNDPNRMVLESIYFGEAIRNILATEGEERIIRNVTLDTWRVFFAHFGMVETELSSSSLYQANLATKKFSYGTCCTLEANGKSLIVGWKGTPIHSLSAWKFF